MCGSKKKAPPPPPPAPPVAAVERAAPSKSGTGNQSNSRKQARFNARGTVLTDEDDRLGGSKKNKQTLLGG